jgi:acetolactate synthase I/III small subunit
MKKKDYTVIELYVNNHPGVMSHITGLFSRRGYNLEGILCGVIGESNTSIMYLLVKENHQLIQIIKQLEKLHDVLQLKQHPEYDNSVFYKIDKLLTEKQM